MQIADTSIPDVKLLTPKRHGDTRGYFLEAYRRDALAKAGVDIEFVQDNQSLTERVGTLRGLHFQRPPRSQAKLVRVLRGSIFDVAVDIRHGSPTFGQHVGLVLDAIKGSQLFVPAGFAHGFVTLEPDTEVLYKVSDYYAPECDSGVIWDDAQLAIDWRLNGRSPLLSEKDGKLPRLSDVATVFRYEKN